MMSMASNLPFPPDPAAAFALRGRLMAAAALTVFLVGGIGLWAVTARLDSAVIGSGSVLVENDMQTIQHVDGGTLREILVKSGQHVAAGDAVLRLDSYEVETQIAMLRAQLMEAEARAARLAAERDGTEMINPASYDPADLDQVRIVEGERRLMEENRISRDVAFLGLDLQADQLRFDSDGLTARRTALMGELELVEALIGIARIRLGERFSYSLQIPAELTSLPLPPLLLQPLVENALRHGIEPMLAGAELQIIGWQQQGICYACSLHARPALLFYCEC